MHPQVSATYFQQVDESLKAAWLNVELCSIQVEALGCQFVALATVLGVKVKTVAVSGARSMQNGPTIGGGGRAGSAAPPAAGSCYLAARSRPHLALVVLINHVVFVSAIVVVYRTEEAC